MVNIPRQQKAVCNREIEKLRGLERYFSRQTHLEAYKQSSQIDKFRAKLVRLNKLRMSTGYEETRAFPIYNPLTQQRIGKTPMLNDQASRSKSSEKIDYTDKPIHTVDFYKKQIPANNGYYYMSANKENNGYSSTGLGRDRIVRSTKLPVLNRQTDTKLNRQTDTKFEIKPCQVKNCQTYHDYQKLDKNLKCYETRPWRANKVDNNKSDKLTVADGELTRRNVNNTIDSFTSQKKKTMRFNRQERLR